MVTHSLATARGLKILVSAVGKVYIVSFRTHDDRRPSKFIVLADNVRSAINMAWEHGGTDFQSRFDKSTAQAEQMKEGATCSVKRLNSKVHNPLGTCACPLAANVSRLSLYAGAAFQYNEYLVISP